jgi:phage gp16-like protein
MTARPVLAKVAIARKELGLDDGTYRAILARLTGKESARDCTDAQLGLVLDEFKAKGWTPRVVAGGRAPRPAARARADHPAAKKARALWISLHQLGVVRDPSEAALEAFARRQLKVEALQWADRQRVYKLIEALKAMAERAGWSQDVTGIDDAEGRAVTLRMRLEVLLEARRRSP